MGGGEEREPGGEGQGDVDPSPTTLVAGVGGPAQEEAIRRSNSACRCPHARFPHPPQLAVAHCTALPSAAPHPPPPHIHHSWELPSKHPTPCSPVVPRKHPPAMPSASAPPPPLRPRPSCLLRKARALISTQTPHTLRPQPPCLAKERARVGALPTFPYALSGRCTLLPGRRQAPSLRSRSPRLAPSLELGAATHAVRGQVGGRMTA